MRKVLYTIVFALLATSFASADYDKTATAIDINDSEIVVNAADLYRHFDGGSTASSNPVDLSSFDNALAYAYDIIKARSLVAEAEKRGYPDEETSTKIAKLEDDTINSYAKDELFSLITIPEEEIREFYDFMDYELKVGLIINPDGEKVREAYGKIQSGDDFGDVAAEYNKDESLKESRGEFPNPIRPNPAPSVLNAFKLKNIGDVTEPFEMQDSRWIIVKLSERNDAYNEENIKPLYDEARESIEGKLIDFKFNDLALELITRDLAEAGIEIVRNDDLYEAGINWEKQRVIDELLGKGKVIARAGEYEYSFDDWWKKEAYFDRYTQEELDENKAAPDGNHVQHFLDGEYDSLKFDLLMMNWADLRNIRAKEDVVWDIWRKSSERTLDNFTTSELEPLIPTPTENEMKAYYDEHIKEYEVADKLRGYFIFFDTPEEAKKYETDMAAEEFDYGEVRKKIALDRGIDLEDREDFQRINEYTFPFTFVTNPEESRKFGGSFVPIIEITPELSDQIFDMAFTLEPESASTYTEFADGYYGYISIAYYNEFKIKTLEEVSASIERTLEKDIIASQGIQDMIENWINDIVDDYKSAIDEDVVKAVYEQWTEDNPIENNPIEDNQIEE